ncbi:MAG: hypothetical protein L3J41_06425 [Melioribacteraceae bacterium]|nr:hypothetical protein [Melioribacteraceae bacterium]
MKSQLIVVVILLTAFSVYSQPNQLVEMRNLNTAITYNDKIKNSIGISENNILGKYFKQTLLIKDFDSTTVIDSVIKVEIGDKYKYTYSYDSDGNSILYLFDY